MTTSWVLPVLAFELVLVIIGATLYYRRARNDKEGNESCLPKVPTRRAQIGLFTFRLLTFLWMLIVQVSQYNWASSARPLYFFTVWNYHLQLIFFGLAALISGVPSCGARSEDASQSMLFRVVHVLFEVSLPTSVLVSMLLWGVLAPFAVQSGDAHAIQLCFDFYSYNQHLANTFLLFIDFIFNEYLVRKDHLVFMLAWAIVYCVFTWIHYPFTGIMPYFFMSLNEWAPMWYTAIVLLTGALYCLALVASSHKKKMFQKRALAQAGARHGATEDRLTSAADQLSLVAS